jgi:ATP-dependent DNA helicase RecQ
MLREQGSGMVLLISPLLALMRNQVKAAERMGVRAVTINSENEDNWQEVTERVLRNEVDILLISPERLASADFRKTILGPIQSAISMLVIDEAHCISDWGHDFRPDYRRIVQVLKHLPSTARVLTTTATANKRVEQDLQDILGPNLTVMRGPLNRDTLTLQTIPIERASERINWISDQLFQIKGHGIIYTLTVKDSQHVADELRSRGHNVEAYSAKLPESERIELEEKLLHNQVTALVATTALGMGFDKPDLSFVFHYQMPRSVVEYYQQAGRAGRAIPSAYGVILYGRAELRTLDFFIRDAFPRRHEYTRVKEALANAGTGMTHEELQSAARVKPKILNRVLNTISKEDPPPFVLTDDLWVSTRYDLDDAYWNRVDRITKLRKAEIRQMQEYVKLPFGEHMRFLMSALGGNPNDVMPPLLPPLTGSSRTTDEPRRQIHSDRFVDTRTDIALFKQRRQWPYRVGYKMYGLYGKIPREHQASIGKALGILDASPWSKHLYACRAYGTAVSAELIHECAASIRSWNPSPRPTWVTCIPSLRHPTLVPDVARAIAAELGLPFHMVLERVLDRPEQLVMQERRKTERGTNLDGAFNVNGSDIPNGNVLLIDDFVYSQWTMTIASWLLRENGSGAVHPFAVIRKFEKKSYGCDDD